MAETVTLAHLSDTHVERHQYPAVSPSSGRNQREQDMLRAFVSVLDDIKAFDPPLVIHSGDVADKAQVSYRTQLQVQHAMSELSVRRDGSPRLVVVISGNHDMPRDPREPCFLEPALRPLPSVVVVTNRYQVIDVDKYIEQGLAPAELAGVMIHALPHDQLKRATWDEIAPIPGKINILTTHGVVGGSDLYKQCHGREYALPIEVLTRGWDYVALGHWHKRGPVAVGGYTDETTPAWYAGSPEHCGFSDLQPGQSGRGYVRVQVRAGQTPQVTPVDLPIRSMFKLPVLDGQGLTYEQVTAELVARARAADVADAVVDQTVINVHRDTWSLVDVAAVRRAAAGALWFQVTPRFASGRQDGSETTAEASERLGDLASTLTTVTEQVVTDPSQRGTVLKMARQLLGSALDAGPEVDPADEGPTSEETGPGQAAA